MDRLAAQERLQQVRQVLTARWRTTRERLAEMRAPRSLRLRLSLWYGGLLAVLLAIFAVVVLSVATQVLDASVRGAIEAEARVALLDVRQQLSPTPPYWPSSLSLNAVDTYRDPGVTIEVLGPQGQLRYHSGTDGVSTVPGGRALVRQAKRGDVAWATVRIDGEPVRIEALPIQAPAPASATGASTQPVVGVLLVAKSLADVYTTLAVLRSLLLGMGTLVFVAALVGGWAIAGRVLTPLAELGATAAEIARATRRGTQLGGLYRRVPHPGGNDELARVVDTVNEMLDSLDRATQSQRRFVADASHELRAPLTTIQGNLAILQAHSDEFPEEERQGMLADAYAETLRLARLVDDLLLLARADAQAEARDTAQRAGTLLTGGTRGAVEVDREVLGLVRSLRGRLQAEGRQTALVVGVIEPARVLADQETVRRVALILLDNALKYAARPLLTGAKAHQKGHQNHERHQEQVRISLQREEDEAVLVVADNGVGIAQEDLPHIFERFYRADQARDRVGTGLGLAIAAELVERLGGRIAVTSTPGKGSTFTVRLPLAQASRR